MNNRIIRNMQDGDKYLIGLFTSFASYFILPSIMMIALMVAVRLKSVDIINDIIDKGNESVYYQSLIIFAQVITNIPIAILFVYFSRKILKADWIKFKNKLGRNVIIIVVSTLLILPATIIVSVIYDQLGIKGVSENESLIRALLQHPYAWVMTIATVLFAPLIEELMFRKFLIGTIETKFKWNPVVAVIISTVIFSLVHVVSDVVFIFQYIPLAAIITLSYHYSDNNIYVSIGVHLLNNLIATLSSFFLSEVILFVFLR